MGAHARRVTCVDVAFSRLLLYSVQLFIFGLISCCVSSEPAVVGRLSM
jgi:hypothetical protein